VFWKGGVWGFRGKSQSQKTTRRSRCSLESDAHGTKDDVTAYQKLCPSYPRRHSSHHNLTLFGAR
ncbi:unnamed protein product, partial [Prunus brigantina]